MNHTDDRNNPFINQYADRVTDPEEVRMRADFARAEEFRRASVHFESEENKRLLLGRAREIDARWRGRDDELGRAWLYLNDALLDWQLEPQFMGEFHDQIRRDQAQGVHVLADIDWRSQQQAREMSGNGTWEQAAEPAPRSALADYQPGHTLADAVARNRVQRDGAER